MNAAEQKTATQVTGADREPQTVEEQARICLAALRERVQTGNGKKGDRELIVQFIDAALDTPDGEDMEFTSFALRAAGGHLNALLEDERAENKTLRDALKAYANVFNWDIDEAGIRRVWLEPDGHPRTAYNGFESARAAVSSTGGKP